MSKKTSSKARTLEPGVSDEQYKLIGEMIAEWSRLEIVLGTLIWHFLDLDMEDGRVVTGTLDARPKVRMLRQLAKRHIKSRAIKTDLGTGPLITICDDPGARSCGITSNSTIRAGMVTLSSW